ncbi:MAG: phenylalanine--tRNA ligase subunit beta, partial [Candidatus Tectomicrobia bacterium]|nr:phenylalanine--tRNA ligase subunit beta [Candidatus Tectomicrobia bacterium]
MKVPLSWLKDFVEITLPVEELAYRLTMAGLEVASIDSIGIPPPGATKGGGNKEEGLIWDREKVLVGEIVEVKPHPNADRLTIAVVNYRKSEPIAVVTGASNINVGDRGQKVVLALQGARLIDGYSEELRYMTLKPTKIRGVPSEGMVCSEKELGLSNEHEGILILDDDAPVGVPLQDYLGEIVLDIELTPNLSHALSIIGIAREVAALTGQRLKKRDEGRVKAEQLSSQTSFISVGIADPDLSSRYSAALIRNVTIKPSSFWMQQRLRHAGMRPIDNIVDITNYCMLEMGQPLHAFDFDRLKGGKIVVRRAKAGEAMITLDNIPRLLTEGMLLITDGSGPVAIAGVMGGAETEVSQETKNILLESANFNFISIRKISQQLKLPSEASQRFGRGID